MNNEKCISVIRVTGHGGCGCSHAVSSCHIFTADTEESLQENLKETLLGWLSKGVDKKEMIEEELENYNNDENRIIDFIEGQESIVEIESHSEQWENLNSRCEFTQMEEVSIELISQD